MKWEQFRSDLRGFARLAYYTIPFGTDSLLIRRLLRGEPSISSVGSKLETLALVMCWRVACWPRSMTLVVTPCERYTRKLIRIAHGMMMEAEDVLRDRVWFTARRQGMTCAGSDIIGVAHCSSGTLGMTLPDGTEPLTFLVPNLDLIPGCHQKYLRRLTSRKGTTAIVNAPRDGSIL